jgi:phosphoribosylcarboxyaminoimidazole (NCAIR) mutase
MRCATDELKRLQIPYEERVFPPSGEGLSDYLEDANGRGVAVAIVGTYHAHTDEQVPSVPEALFPVIRFVTGPMPPTLGGMALNVASTGFGVDGAVNAALQAARILALTDPALAERLRARLDRPES